MKYFKVPQRISEQYYVMLNILGDVCWSWGLIGFIKSFEVPQSNKFGLTKTGKKVIAIAIIFL